jgi:hypothetical protein
MAKNIQINVDANYKGAGAIRQASADVKSLEKSAKTAGSGIVGGFRAALPAIAAAGAAMGALALAAKGALSALTEGAQLSLIEDRFNRLAESIGSTADVMLGKLKEATSGMMSDANLMASATDIMSLGLAKTEEDTIRLATVVGTLGWDMQQVILTFANNSKMRLDALGLSVEEVTARAKELEAAGMDMDRAFDLAVIEAGEKRIQLLGNTADSTAGKIKQLTVVWENARNAFNQAFAEGVAAQFEMMTGSVMAYGVAIEGVATGAAKVLSRIITHPIFTNPLFRDLMIMGMEEMIDQAKAERAAQALGAINGDMAQLGTQMDEQRRKSQNYSHIFDDIAISAEGLDWALRNNAYAVEDWRSSFEGLAVDTGIFGDNAEIAKHKALEFGEALGGAFYRSAEEMEAAKQAAEELAAAYEEAGRRMGEAFTGFVNDPSAMPDFGDASGMADMAWDMAAAFGLSVEQAGALGIALGQFSPEMADAAAKAVIFQEALGSLIGQFAAGNLDTSGFVSAFDALIADMESKSLIEIQVELKYKETAAADFAAAADLAGIGFAETALEVPVTFTPEETALNDALSKIDGIPDNETKIITFDAEYAAVTSAVGTVEASINAIDGTVTFLPITSDVDNAIARIDGQVVTVVVNFVEGTRPEVPTGRASGGRVERGNAYIVGEYRPELFIPDSDGRIVPSTGGRSGGSGVTINNYITGGDTATVERAMRRTADDVVRAWRRAGGSR